MEIYPPFAETQLKIPFRCFRRGYGKAIRRAHTLLTSNPQFNVLQISFLEGTARIFGLKYPYLLYIKFALFVGQEPSLALSF